MGRRADGAADALGVDVALVGKRQPGIPQRIAEAADRRPGSARTRPVGASTCVIPSRLARSISVPPVRWTGENECPVATTRTPWPAAIASRTAVCAAASLAGDSRRAGLQVWFPTQFTNVVTARRSSWKQDPIRRILCSPAA